MIVHSVQPELPRGHPMRGEKRLDPLKQLGPRAHEPQWVDAFSPVKANLRPRHRPSIMSKISPTMAATAPLTHLQREITRRMNALGIKARKLSLTSGLGPSAVKEILNGKVRSPRGETLAALARVLGCSSMDLTGEPRGDSHAPTPEANGIHEIAVRASAGGGSMPDTEHVIAEWRFPGDWLRHELRSAFASLRVITIEGDSMTPTLHTGDKVIIDVSRTLPSPPGVYALWDGLALVAKRLEYIEGSDPPTVRILSDNAHYRPYERTADEINIIGRIMGRWQRL